MNWELIIIIVNTTWALVFFAGINSWFEVQKMKPRTVVDHLTKSDHLTGEREE